MRGLLLTAAIMVMSQLLCAVSVPPTSTMTFVVVQWGDHGKRIKSVRAIVARFPYLAEGRNDVVDTLRPRP